jgi:pilus assembly protein CpaF
MIVARRLLAQAGVTVDPSRPIHEGMTPDGVRVLAVMPPVALRGPVIELRRSARVVQPQDLVDRGYVSGDMLELMRTAVRGRRNVVVSGPVGSGVTTLLAGIAGLTSDTERLVTVEDVPDLSIPRRHVIGLSTGGPSGLTLRQVLQQANRLRCDRMVIDDVRGVEARDVLVTMASRRDGMLVGVHASSAQDALGHLELLARLESGSPSVAVRQLIAEAVHLLVQVSRLEDGTRRVTAITEVVGLSDGQIETQDLYVWQDEFLSTGNEPRFLRG